MLKFSPEGDRLWARSFPRLSWEQEFTRTLLIDSRDRIAIASSIESNDDDPRGTSLVRLAPNGTVLSSVTADMQINAFTRLAVDAQDNLYVAGTEFRSGSGYDIVAAKYDLNGQRIWVAYHTSPLVAVDQGTATVIGLDNEVYVAGHAQARVGEETDLVLIKYGQAVPLRLGIMQMSNGTVQLMLPSLSSGYHLEASSDLVNWTSLSTASGAGGSVGVPASAPAFPWRFYRLASP